MLASFRKFISDIASIGSDEAEIPRFDAGDKRLAAAALMFHVIAADGVVDEDEQAKLRAILAENYEVKADEVDELIEEARKADSEAIDLYAFTRVIKRQLSHEERISLVEHLWEMVFADGEMHEFEDNIVWRVADLIAVSQQDRISMKQRVLARQKQ